MAAELGKFITEQLAKLSPGHPDRPLLKGTLDIVNAYSERVSRIGEYDTSTLASIEEAKEKVRTLVEKDSLERKMTAKKIMDLKKRETERFGEESIVNLLPTESRKFTRIINALIQNEVRTKQDLADTSLLRIKEFRNIGPASMEIIEAIRGLAIAEIYLPS